MLDNWLSILKQYPLIGVIRCDSLELGRKKAQVLADSGIKLIEITWNSYQPHRLIEVLRQDLPHCYIGTGTILDSQALLSAIASGVQFSFSPHCDPKLINIAHSHNIPFIPGTLTPTEIITAFSYGVKTVKVFPVQSLGGIQYIKNILAPLPHLSLIPTGGVTLSNSLDYLKAGAIAVGLASDLFPADLVKQGQWREITERIKPFVKTVKNYS